LTLDIRLGRELCAHGVAWCGVGDWIDTWVRLLNGEMLWAELLFLLAPASDFDFAFGSNKVHVNRRVTISDFPAAGLCTHTCHPTGNNACVCFCHAQAPSNLRRLRDCIFFAIAYVMD